MFFKDIKAACRRRAEFKYLGDRISGGQSTRYPDVARLGDIPGEHCYSMLMSSVQLDREKQKYQEACSL